jgi:PAS domain S-box-containing protein
MFDQPPPPAPVAPDGREDNLRTIVEGMTQGVLVIQGGAVRYANPAGARLFGFDAPSRLIGQALDGLSHADDLARLREQIESASKGEPSPAPFSWRGVRADGAEVRLAAEARSIPWEGGRAVALFLTEAPVADRSADELRLAEEMEAGGRVTAGVAHDFNNVLMVITGYANLLLSQLPGDSPWRKQSEQIAAAAEQAAALTRRLLSLCRGGPPDPKPLRFNDLLDDLAPLLAALTGPRIELVIDKSAGPGLVQADRARLEQALLNLVLNALAAMPSGGKLTLRTGTVRRDGPAGTLPAGYYALLEVVDTGRGITDADLARLFEPPAAAEAPGVGLGLFTARELVRQYGGDIEVESAPGRGSTFRVCLPRLDPPPPPGLRTVLVVEDDDMVRLVYRKVLSGAGYRVLEAGDGVDALRLSDEHTGDVDLLLTDVIMPRMGGRETADRLRQRRPGLPVLYVSGFVADAAVVEDGKSGSDFLPKPFLPDTLLRKVKEMLP